MPERGSHSAESLPQTCQPHNSINEPKGSNDANSSTLLHPDLHPDSAFFDLKDEHMAGIVD